ncbi:MAG: hypothetical protein KDB06_13730, partial [Ilumatobacter sp.]|nr:hypothetical protein [Ilumatobacter sp.]MCB0985704.1 hypothetical protein [Ilumatobacter sp.]
MSTVTLSPIVAELEATDISTLDEQAVRAAMQHVARLSNWTAAVRSALVRRLDDLADLATGAPSPPNGAGDPGGQRAGEQGAGQAGQAGDPAPAVGGPPPKPAELELADSARISEREAARQATLARLLAHFPLFAAALQASTVAESHVQVLGRCWHQMSLADRDRLKALDATLVRLAAAHGPERFRRLLVAEVNRLRADDGVDRLVKQRRATGLTHWVDDSGMVNLRAMYDPERGQRLLAKLRSARTAMVDAGREPPDCPDGDTRWEHLDAIALYELVCAGGAMADVAEGGPRSMFTVPDAEVVVLIDEATLRSGVHAATQMDTGSVDLPVETVRQMACDAGIIPVVLGGDGQVLDVGRVRRLATHAQRVALRAMYATCAVPECDVPYDRCQPHHLHVWGAGGSTDLDSLAPLCSRHHPAVHTGGWTIVIDPADRRITVTRPDGTVLTGYPDRWRTKTQRSNAFDTADGTAQPRAGVGAGAGSGAAATGAGRGAAGAGAAGARAAGTGAGAAAGAGTGIGTEAGAPGAGAGTGAG